MNIAHEKTVEILELLEKINRTPRCSGNEEDIALWLMGWAKENAFDARRDGTGNLVICVPASSGYENSPTVIIQGHMDMVCEKTPDSPHDFSKDPITHVYDGEWLKADRTTLGADNGIAIAMGMAAATDKTLKRPPLELLFTVDEERGLTGAFALESDFVQGRILLNIDSEEEGVFTVGCAGGLKSKHTLPLQKAPITPGSVPLTITACGMAGGHSADIHFETANAIKVLTRTLDAVMQKTEFRMADIKGGTADNAIPRECQTLVYIPADKEAAVAAVVDGIRETIKAEFKNTDPNLDIQITKDTPGEPSEILTPADTTRLIDFILAAPHGIWAMSTEVKNFVETSNNFANVRIESNQLIATSSQRSPVYSRLDAVTQQLEKVVRLAGGGTENKGRYPGWNADMKSPLLAKCIAVYENLYEKQPVVETTHGGLECGVIGSKVPGMDMISFGPTIHFPHSPEEKIHIPAVGRVWDFLAALLASF
ncbi:MAG: aminoacyl-histidine dipeptidase [bacterium]|nr:aminoacyl-histidine dipeptidase [bacterium]